MKKGRYRMRVQTTITLMVLSVVALALLALYVMISFEISGHTREALEQRAVGIARTVSLTPTIRQALDSAPDLPNDVVQQYAEAVRHANDIQFVVVMDMDGTRLSHPDPSLIGQHFAGGDETPALSGREFVSTASGSLGPSIRAFSPIYGADGVQIGAVAVGMSLGSVRTAVGENMWLLYGGMLLGALLGIFGAVMLGRRLKRMMLGMEPHEIARKLEERSAMLQSAKEGIVAVDKDLRITLINAEARRLIGDRDGDNESTVQAARREDSAESDFRSLLRMDRVLASGEPVYDLEAERGGTALLVNVVPIRIGGSVEGAIATFRDKTEISVLMERLSGISLYADALRAQTHEFMNKLHIIMGLTHMKRYDRLETYLQEAVPSLQIEAGTVTTQIKDPVMAGFLLGKLSLLREAGIRLTVSEAGVLPEAAQPSVSRELVTIVGNLLQNAMEAPRAEAVDKAIGVGFVYEEGRLRIEVSDNGIGIPANIAASMYEQGYSTKGDDRGVGLYLVRRSAERLGGRVCCDASPETGTCFVVELPYDVAKKGVGK